MRITMLENCVQRVEESVALEILRLAKDGISLRITLSISSAKVDQCSVVVDA